MPARNVIAAACLYLLSTLALAATTGEQDASPMDRQIQSVLDSARVPGASVALLRDRKIVYQQTFGFADLEAQTTVTPHTVFEAASLSKAVFAYIAMQLVEEGQLALDRPLYQYFPEPLPKIDGYEDFAGDERYRRLTARLVLRHATGLPNWRGQTEGQLVFTSDPGETFTYSGEGFGLLQLAVEQLTGQSLEDLARQRVFQPLGMHDTSYRLPEGTRQPFAQGYNELTRPRGKSFIEQGHSAFSLHSHAGDFARFMLALLNGQGLRPDTLEAMLSVQTTYTQSYAGRDYDLHWGLGVAVAQMAGRHYVWHGGSNDNFKALALVERSSGDGIVYFGNSELADYILWELLGVTLDGFGFEEGWFRAAFGSEQLTPAWTLALELTKRPYDEAVRPYLDEQGRLAVGLEDGRLAAGRLASSGYSSKALAVYAALRERYPDGAELLTDMGIAYLRAGQARAAEDLFEQVASIDPDYAPATTVLAGLRARDRQGNTDFYLEGHQEARLVVLAGDFSNWNELGLPMRRSETGWKLSIDLPPGEHYYKFIADGEWLFDPANGQRGLYGGVMNSKLVK